MTISKNLLVAILAMDSKGGQGFGDYICAFNKINFAAYQGADPLVLDLDGHGLALKAQNSSSLLYDFDHTILPLNGHRKIQHGAWMKNANCSKIHSKAKVVEK